MNEPVREIVTRNTNESGNGIVTVLRNEPRDKTVTYRFD